MTAPEVWAGWCLMTDKEREAFCVTLWVNGIVTQAEAQALVRGGTR